MSAPNNQPISREDKARFEAYRVANPSWGHLALVLKSGSNVKDGHVLHCQKEAARHGDQEAYELADILLSLSKSQRIKLGQQLG